MFPKGKQSIEEQFLEQSGRQIAASGGRPLVWIFAEWEAALFARKLFDTAKEGRESIHVVHMPWTTRKPR
jgi:NADPH-dependent ferric siderophore reductase